MPLHTKAVSLDDHIWDQLPFQEKADGQKSVPLKSHQEVCLHVL